jgi:undecaprenyl diphosphate synthase
LALSGTSQPFFSTERGQSLLARFDASTAPAHVAVIMDGNGRWAAKRTLPRVAGHRAGAKATEEAIATALELGVRYLTIYSFSSENWRRPKEEVDALMGLFVEVLKAKMDDLMRESVRVRVLGRLDEMPAATAQAFRDAMATTAANDRRLLPADVGEDTIASRLYTAGVPDPDLLVRTSGELRVSNFLLWQIAYTELYVTDVLWPDFDRDEFLAAVVDFQERERRFGGR